MPYGLIPNTSNLLIRFLMLWTAPTTGIAMRHIPVAIAGPRESAYGYKRRFGAGASHGRSTLNFGSQNPNVGFLINCFSFTPDSGRE